jgi:hypothetical protein
MRDRAIHNELFKQLDDHNPDVRVAAAYSLGKMKVRRGIKHLARALQDHIPAVRYHAAWALGVIRDPKAFIYLKIAKLDHDADVQCAIQHALFRLTQPSAESLTQTLTTHPNPEKRAQAAQSLGFLGESYALEALASALKDPSLCVRLKSIQAIACLDFNGDPNVLKTIMGVLYDENPVFRLHALRAIRCLGACCTRIPKQATTKTTPMSGIPAITSPPWAVSTWEPQHVKRRRMVKRVLDCLCKEPDSLVRVEAIRTLEYLLGYAAVAEPRWDKTTTTKSISPHDDKKNEPLSFVVLEGGITKNV